MYRNAGGDTIEKVGLALPYASNVTHWNDYDETNNPTGVNGSTHPESYDPGELYWDGTISDGSSNQTSSTGDPHYHLGNYYNWTAAVAMNNSSDYTTAGTLIEQSICPAGWTLPRIGTGEDTFVALWNAYNFNESSFTDANSNSTWDSGENALWTSPLYFAASGYWGGELGVVGGGGDFWSPVVYNDGYAHLADFNTYGYVSPDVGDYRGRGFSVRCVARPVASTVSFDTGGDSGGGGR